MSANNAPMFNAKPDESAEFRIDEARKKGSGSPGGLFVLLGELDYYSLIESLIKGPITDKQLMTPYRWWIFFKGSANSSMVGLIIIMMRLGFLLPGETMDFRIKFGTYMVFYFFVIFGFGKLFLNYIHYPDGSTWLAIKFALSGFIFGMFISETIKSIILLVTLYAKPWITRNWYGQSSFGDSIYDFYYTEFVHTYSEELALLGVCYASILYLWIYFNRITEYQRNKIKKGTPYDLGMEQ